MQLRIPQTRIRVFLVAAAALSLAVMLRKPLLSVASLAFVAALLCFIAQPIAAFFERKLSRGTASLASLACIGIAVSGLAWLLLPTVFRELTELAGMLPRSAMQITDWFENLRAGIETHFHGIELPALNQQRFDALFSGVADGTMHLAVNLADLAGRLSLSAILAFFFLCDRERILLRLELLLPSGMRSTAVQMGNAVCRELRLYLQGQLLVAAAVSALSTVALLLIGLRNALVLGLLIGLLNMIPYFGPFIGGAPAVLIALGYGWQKALLTLLALTAVQQLDGSWISPRILGGVTGFGPAPVLVGIYAGARIAGIAGMLLALPTMLTLRTLFRVFVQKCENI